MLRVRFHANPDDYRPVKWPVKYPFWCTGYGENHSVVVAYVDSVDELTELWPEASNLDIEERESITFTDRFPKPNWYNG